MSKLSRCVLGLAVVAVATTAGATEITFSDNPIWLSPHNAWATGIVWADFNGDGWLDPAVGYGLDVVSNPDFIYFNDAGTLSSAALWASDYSIPSCQIYVTDFDKNGGLDLLVSSLSFINNGSPPIAQVLYYDNDGLSTMPDWYSRRTVAFSCTGGDPDGDGDIDITFSQGDFYSGQPMRTPIYFNTDGHFDTIPEWQTDSSYYGTDVDFADLDRDGDLDFILSGNPLLVSESVGVAIFFNSGGVLETTPSWKTSGVGGAIQTALGDVNGDGYLDMAVANGYNENTYALFLNDNGTMAQTPVWTCEGYQHPTCVVWGDADGDGDLDLAATGWNSVVGIFENVGGTLSDDFVWTAAVATYPQQMVFADFDEDCLIDTVTELVSDGSRKLFYLDHPPIHELMSIEIDGIPMNPEQYCFDLAQGWVSLASPPSAGAVLSIQYRVSFDLDLTVTDGRAKVYENQRVNGLKLLSLTLSDDTYGDGDAISEAGETIELELTLMNNLPASLGGVAASFGLNDASLEILDGISDLGWLDFNDTTDNSSDPMSFHIPEDYISRIDTLYLALAYGRARVDTLAFAVHIGHPRVLLVDDAAGTEVGHYYTALLDEFSIAYHLWDIATDGYPTSTGMADYDVVIWFIGDYIADPLHAEEIAALTAYMDGGGKLFLTGQGLGLWLYLFDNTFLNNYLKSQYVASGYVPVLAVTPSAQVFSPGDSIVINGTDGGIGNQTNPDQVSPTSGGTGEIRYIGSDNCGAVSYAGDYRLVFFTFGFEAVSRSSWRWTNSDTVLRNILDFFEFVYPAAPPTVTAIGFMTEDPAHVTDHQPEISWAYRDDGSLPQVYYQIQAGVDPDWTIAEMWDSGPVSGDDTVATYTGSELADGQVYYLRVRASNGIFWSGWRTDTFRMNSVPVPEGLAPDNLEEIFDNPPCLCHEAASDGEGDAVTYDYQLFDDEFLTVLLEEAYGISGEGADTVCWQAVVPLADNRTYFWHARCSDAYESGEWSAPATFRLLPAYICGDANGDASVNVADAVYIINYTFKGGPEPIPLMSGDANCDGVANVADAVYLISYVFKGGPAACAGCG